MRRICESVSDGELGRIAAKQQAMEVLRMRAQLLDAEDRALATTFLESGVSLYQLARLSGTSMSTIARRMRRIVQRLSDETYSLCVKSRHCFTELELEIVCDHFVRGLSARRISRERNVSYYSALTTIEKARRFARSRKKA
jgi:hypothetical protein